MALAKFEQIKDFLELKKAAATDYPTLNILLKAMQSTFETFCSREFDLKERTAVFRVLDEDGEDFFWLKGTPIESVASVTVNGTEVGFTFGEADIKLEAAALRHSKVEVTYTGGLIDQTDDTSFLATIPADLNLAAIRQISFEYQNRAKLAATDIRIDTSSAKIPSLELLKYTMNTLNAYKNLGSGF